MNTPEPNQPDLPAWPDAGPLAGAEPGAESDDAGLSAALSVLRGLPELPVADHAGVYEGLHDVLLQALDAGEDAAGPAAGEA